MSPKTPERPTDKKIDDKKSLEKIKMHEATIEKIMKFNTRESADLLLRFTNGNVDALKMLLFLNSKDVKLREQTPDEQAKAQRKITKAELKHLKKELKADAKDDSVLGESLPSHLLEFEDPVAAHDRLQEVIAKNPGYELVSQIIDETLAAAEKGEEALASTTNAHATALSVNAGMVELDRATVETVTAENIELLYKLGVVTEADIQQFQKLPKEELAAYTQKIDKKLQKYGLDLTMLALVPTDMVARLVGDESYFAMAIGTAKSIIGKLDNITKLANIQVYKSAFEALGPEVDKMTLVSINKMTFFELEQVVLQLQALEGGVEHPLIKGEKAEQILKIYEHLRMMIDREIGGEKNIAKLMKKAMEAKFRRMGLTEKQKEKARNAIEAQLGGLHIGILPVDKVLQLVHTDPSQRNENVLLGGIGGGVGSLKWGVGKLADKYAQHSVQAAKAELKALEKAGASTKKIAAVQAKLAAAEANLVARAGGTLTAKQAEALAKSAAAGGTLRYKLAKYLPGIGAVTALSMEMSQLARGNSKPRESFYNLTENILPWIPGIGNVAGVALNLKAALSGYNLAGKKLSSEEIKWRYGFAALSAIPFLGTVLSKGLKTIKGGVKLAGKGYRGTKAMATAAKEGRGLAHIGERLAKAGKVGKEAVFKAAAKGGGKVSAVAKEKALKYSAGAAIVGGSLVLGGIAADYQFGEKGREAYTSGLKWIGKQTVDAGKSFLSLVPRRTEKDDFNETLNGIIADVTGMPMEGVMEVSEGEEIGMEGTGEKTLAQLKRELETEKGKKAREILAKQIRKKTGLEENIA